MAEAAVYHVGSGWRSLFYWRIAQALPERFELCAMLCRTEEKAEKNAPEVRRAGKTSAEQCCPAPGLVVVAVNKASIAAVSTEWLAGLCRAERDPGGAGGGRIARPLAAAGRAQAAGGRAVLAVPHAGKTAGSSAGRRTGHAAVFARLSVAHGYHAVSLARLFRMPGSKPVR